MKHKNTASGALALTLSALIYGSYGSLSRVIGLQFGAFAQNTVRNFIVVLLVLIYFLISKNKLIKIKRQDFKWVFSWALIGTINMVLLFISFNNLPIGTTYFLFYVGLIASGILTGKIIFNERMNLKKYLAILFLFIGLLVIYTLDISKNDTVYLIYCIIGGLTVGVWSTLNKKFSDNYNEFELVLIDSSFGVIVSLIGLLIFEKSFPIPKVDIHWLGVLLNAIGQFFTTFLIIFGFKKVEAQVGTIILPMEIVFGSLFGFMFFKEILSVSTIIGGALILFAAILPYLPKTKLLS